MIRGSGRFRAYPIMHPHYALIHSDVPVFLYHKAFRPPLPFRPGGTNNRHSGAPPAWKNAGLRFWVRGGGRGAAGGVFSSSAIHSLLGVLGVVFACGFKPFDHSHNIVFGLPAEQSALHSILAFILYRATAFDQSSD